MTDPTTVRLEVCADGIESALAAQSGGAHRVELCASLSDGGVTPSVGCIEAARAALTIPTVVLVRPRSGDFVYTPRELDSMVTDVERVRALGCAGVAVGCLLPDGTLDVPAMRRLQEAAGSLDVVCHRAFDMVRDQAATLETLIDLKIPRVLTSGGAQDVIAGLPSLKSLIDQASGRITVMPGGGVRPGNIRHVVTASGASVVHFSARETSPGPMRYRNEACSLASHPGAGDATRTLTTANAVREYVSAIADSR